MDDRHADAAEMVGIADPDRETSSLFPALLC